MVVVVVFLVVVVVVVFVVVVEVVDFYIVIVGVRVGRRQGGKSLDGISFWGVEGVSEDNEDDGSAGSEFNARE